MFHHHSSDQMGLCLLYPRAYRSDHHRPKPDMEDRRISILPALHRLVSSKPCLLALGRHLRDFCHLLVLHPHHSRLLQGMVEGDKIVRKDKDGIDTRKGRIQKRSRSDTL